MEPVKTIWRTRDGRSFRICDMEDDHLLNCLKYAERKAEKRRTTPERLWPVYNNLIEDGIRRGIVHDKGWDE